MFFILFGGLIFGKIENDLVPVGGNVFVTQTPDPKIVAFAGNRDDANAKIFVG